MLEGLLAQLLDGILGKYVDGIDSKAARMSVWSGHISLKDLKLKKSALDDFDLPAKLKYGHLEELKLDIPWKNLRSKPVSVKINGLYIVLAAHAEGSLSAEEKDEREKAAKRAMIAELDAAGPQVVPTEGAESFSARLITKVIDNIQIDISNIHIRYEDRINDSDHQFAFGIMLSRFAAESTDTNWKPSFVENQKVLFKLASLRGLSVYLNADQKAQQADIETLLGDDFAEKLKGMVGRCAIEQEAENNQSWESFNSGKGTDYDPIFIVRPIDATCKIKMNKSDIPDPKVPKYDIGLEMSRVALQLEKRQYRDLIRTLDFVSNFERICRYNQFRPGKSAMQAPREWWGFAFRCLTWEREQRMQRFDKQKLFTLMLLWPRYARLFKRTYASTFDIEELSEEEKTEMKTMEDQLPIEAITTARDAIHRLLKVRIEELEAAKRKEEKEKPKGGFYSMVSRWVPTWGSKTSDDEKGNLLTAAEAQQQLMMEMGIDDDATTEDTVEASGVDASQITRVQMQFVLHSGSLTMLSHSEEGGEIPITRLTYKNVKMLMMQKPATLEVTMQLSTIVVYDLFTMNLASGFHRIVSRHVGIGSGGDPRGTFQSFPASAKFHVNDGGRKTATSWGLAQTLQALQGWSNKYEQGSEDSTPVLSFSYQSAPQDGNADSRVVVKLESMSIVYNVKWVAALNDFLDVGASPAVEAMKKSAQHQLEQAKARSEQNMKSALQAKLVMDLCLDLKSPVIYVPVSLDADVVDSQLLVLKPGNLSLWSLKSHLPETSKLLRAMVSADDVDDRYYNSLLFELSGVQMLVVPRDLAFAAASNSCATKEFDLIDDIRISICIDNSIAPSNPALTRTKIKLAFPSLNLKFSKKKYHALLAVLAANTGGNSTQDQTTNNDTSLTSAGKGITPVPSSQGRAGPSPSLKPKDSGQSVSMRPNDVDTEQVEASVVSPAVAAEWKHLDVFIWIAPNDPISMRLSDEDVSPMQPIADLNIKDIKVNYISYGDNSSTMEAAIASVEATDARPDTKNCFRRLIAPKDKTQKFFSVLMSTTKEGAAEYSVWIGHLDMVLIPEALYPIAGVFAGPEQGEQAPSKPDPKGPTIPENMSTTMEVSQTQVPAKPTSGPVEQKGSVYNLFVVLPTVTLVEAADNPQSRRLTMQLSFMAKHAMLPNGSQQGQAHLQDLRLFVHEDSPPVEKQILERCSLSLEYEFGADGSSKLWMMSRELDLKVSYENLKMLYTIYKTLLPDEEPVKPAVHSSIEKAEEFSDILSQASAKIVEAQKSIPDSTAKKPSNPGPTQFSEKHYRIDFGTFRMTLVNDCAGFNQPFASLLFQDMSAMSVGNAQGDEYNAVNAQTLLSLFNHKIMEYEPVMEEWNLTAESSVKRSPAAVVESGVKCHGGIPSSVEMYKISSAEVLNFNVTESHMSSVVSTLTAWQKDWDHFTASKGFAVSEEQNSRASAHSAYQIQNRCGLPLGVRTVLRDAGKQGALSQVVQPLDTQPLVLEERFWSMNVDDMPSDCPATPSVQKVKYPPPIFISHEDPTSGGAPGFDGGQDLPGFSLAVHENSSSILSLGDGTKILAQVKTEKESASHVLTVHSQLAIRNECQVPLNVALSLIDSSQPFVSRVDAGATIDVPPLQVIQDNLFSLRVAAQPVQSPDAPWTDAALVAEDLDIVINSQVVDMEQNEAMDFFVRVVARTRTEKSDAGEPFEIVSICFLPVIMVTNLLPCPICFSFSLENSDSPMPSYLVESGEERAIHEFALSKKVNIGFSLGALTDSEFVPIFCPDGSALETYVNLFDSNKDLLRLQLEHEQEALKTFRVSVFSPYWFVNRTGYPIVYGQKWTASNVTMLGGQTIGEPDEMQTDGLDMRDLLSGDRVRPQPFAFHYKTDVGGAKATIRLGGKHQKYNSREGRMVPCEWCSPFTIDSVGSSAAIELVGESFTVDLVVQVSLAQQAFRRTKVVTLLPRYVVCNNLSRPIELGQVGCEAAGSKVLHRHDIVVVKWLDESKDRRVRVRLLPDKQQGHSDWHWEWSGGILPQTVGYSPLKVRAGKLKVDGTHDVFNMMVHAAMSGLVTVLTVHEQNENPAILVQNDSKWAGIAFRQAGVAVEKEEKTSPGESAGFCWDDPHSPPILEVRIEQGNQVKEITSCNMDRLGKFPTLKVGDAALNISVVARGPTKVLHVTDCGSDESAISEMHASLEQSMASDASVSTGMLENNMPHLSSTVTHYNVDLAGVGVSIIDSTPQELIYLSMLGLSLKSVKAGDWELNHVHLKRFQIDNQTLIGPPVLLGQGAMSLEEYEQRIAAQERGQVNRSEMTIEEATAQMDEETSATPPLPGKKNDNFFSIKVTKNLKNPSLDCYDLVDIAFSDTSISCDEKVLIQLLRAFSGILAKLAPKSDEAESTEQAAQQVGTVGAIDLSDLNSDRSSAAMRWTYIESLKISPIRVFITFTSSDDASGLLDSLGPISKLPVFAFIEAAKAVVTNIDRAPIVLNNIDWDRPFLPQEELIQRITKHYTNNVMRGFYRLVGSLEFLGNPTGLVSNIGQGFHGFVDYSVEGFKEGQVVKGLAYGAGSLTAGAVQGVFGSAAGLSGAMGKGLAQLTFDGDYKRARSILDHDRPMHLGQGVYRGGKSFGKGILLGVTGIVTQPVKGFSRHGATGAIKGVGKGFVGLVVKPMAGVADLVSQTSEGIRNTPEYISQKGVINRVRLPRQWQPGTAVKGYDKRTALGVAMLTKLSLQEGWPVNDLLLDHAAWHDAAIGPVVLFITINKMILCRRSRFTTSRTRLPQLNLCFAALIKDILQILDEGNCIDILLRGAHGQMQCLPSRRNMGACMNRAKNSCHWRLTMPDREMRNWLLDRLRNMTMTDSSHLKGEDWVMVTPNRSASDLEERSGQDSHGRASIQDAEHLMRRMQISISKTSLRNGHTIYEINCTVLDFEAAEPTHSWTVHKRYSEFVKLRKAIIKEERASSITQQQSESFEAVPSLPPARWWGRTSERVVNERISGLEDFLLTLKRQSWLPPRALLAAKFLQAFNH